MTLNYKGRHQSIITTMNEKRLVEFKDCIFLSQGEYTKKNGTIAYFVNFLLPNGEATKLFYAADVPLVDASKIKAATGSVLAAYGVYKGDITLRFAGFNKAA